MSTARFFATYPVFTTKEFLEHSGAEAKTGNPATQKSLLAYHRRAGHLLPVRRGLYAVIPVQTTTSPYPVDAYLIAARLTEDAVLAYTTALSYHGLAHSIHYTFFCLRDSQQNKCSSPRSLPSHLCGSDFSRQPKWNSLILESPLPGGRSFIRFGFRAQPFAPCRRPGLYLKRTR